jgi:type IV pilus assembly protein PilB
MKSQPTPTAPREAEVVDMATAMAMLGTTRPTFYRWVRSGRLQGMKVGRQWRFYRSEIERFLSGSAPRIELTADPAPLLTALAELSAKVGEPVPPPSGDPIADAVMQMVRLGLVARASDIHLGALICEPGSEAEGLLRFRIDGVLQHATPFDRRLLPALVRQWKTLSGCNAQVTNLPQDGRMIVTTAHPRQPGKTMRLDLRVCFLPSALGESVTARLLDTAAIALRLEKFDYAPEQLAKLRQALASSWGMIIVTGPTGSGKTTTLYACLNEFADGKHKLVSIEDPVEYVLPWATQMAVRPSEGLTFASGIRAILRSDPDVILIGELRDRETLQIGHQAAITGHLVLTTMHTADAASALRRMIEVGSDPFLVAESVRMITGQRLVRKLCQACRQPAAPPPELLRAARAWAAEGGLDWGTLTEQWYRPVGCPACGQTGFRGRTVITEFLAMTPALGDALRHGAETAELQRRAIADGMVSLAADGVRRAAAGQTTLEEVRRALSLG